jgi:membrane-bound lytic murein transglycosylase D
MFKSHQLSLLLALVIMLLILSGCQSRVTYDDQFLGKIEGRGDLWNDVRKGMKIKKPLNARVEKELNHYLTNPSIINRMQSNARPYLYDVVAEIQRRDMPMELVMLAAVESMYQPHVYSRSGAAGIWQFIPATGRAYGLDQSRTLDYRRDPLASTKAALDYLQYLHKYFDGDWTLAIAAYNGGEGTIKRARDKNRKAGLPTDFWSLEVRKETMDYVPKIYAMAIIVENPSKYKVNLRPIPPVPVITQVQIDKSIDLAEAARLSNMNPESFTSLNALYVQKVTPERSSRVLVPRYHQANFMLAVNQMASSDWNRIAQEASGTEVYRVKQGDTLSAIARRHNTTVARIKQDNNLRSDNLKVGQRLTLVAKNATGRASAGRATPAPSAPAALAAAPVTVAAATTDRIHVVVKGDTLFGLAKRYDVSVKMLQDANGLTNQTTIKTGQRLTIPGSSS